MRRTGEKASAAQWSKRDRAASKRLVVTSVGSSSVHWRVIVLKSPKRILTQTAFARSPDLRRPHVRHAQHQRLRPDRRQPGIPEVDDRRIREGRTVVT